MSKFYGPWLPLPVRIVLYLYFNGCSPKSRILSLRGTRKTTADLVLKRLAKNKVVIRIPYPSRQKRYLYCLNSKVREEIDAIQKQASSISL